MSMVQRAYNTIIGSFKAFNDLVGLLDLMIEQSNKARQEIQDLQCALASERERHEFVTQQLMDNLCDMVWAKSVPEFRYIYANKAIKELLLHVDNPTGMTDNDIQSIHAGHNVEVVCNASDVAMWNEYLRREAAGEPTAFTLNFLEHIEVKGKDMYLEVRKSMMFSPCGKPIAIVGSGRITNYKAEKAAVDGIACGIDNMPACKRHLLKQVDKYLYEANTSKPIDSFKVDELVNQFKD